MEMGKPYLNTIQYVIELCHKIMGGGVQVDSSFTNKFLVKRESYIPV